MSDNRGQHVVSRFYLQRFANEDGKLWCLETATGRIFPGAPKDLAKERDAFSIDGDDSFDEINNNVEDHCAPILAQLENSSLGVEENTALLALTANFLLRSRRVRDSFLARVNRVADMTKSMNVSQPENEKERRLFELFGIDDFDPVEAAEAISKAAKLMYPTSLILLENVTRHLESRRFDILIAPPEFQFITSDEPAISLKEDVLTESDLPPTQLLEDLDVSVIMPLDPATACVWAEGSSLETRTISEEEVEKINRLLAESAYLHAFSPEEAALEALREEKG